MKNIKKLLVSFATAAIAAAALTAGALAANEATVTADELNMRAGAGTEYEVLDAAPCGSTVSVETDMGNGWYQVIYRGQYGFMHGDYLSFTGTPAQPPVENAPVQPPVESVPAPEAVPAPVTPPSDSSNLGTIRGAYVRFRSAPSLNAYVVDYLHDGTTVTVYGQSGDWYEIEYNGNVGYVSTEFLTLGGTAAPAPAPVIPEEPVTPSTPAVPETPVQPAPADPTVPAPTTPPVTPQAPSNSAVGQQAVDLAMQYLGVPYVWGGTSPSGFDCSGLVYYVYGQLGYKLNRVAQSMYYNGTAVDLNDLQPGDILLFGSSVYNIWHAAIYVGDGNFIHAPQTGEVVKIQALSETYGIRLVAARRIG